MFRGFESLMRRQGFAVIACSHTVAGSRSLNADTENRCRQRSFLKVSTHDFPAQRRDRKPLINRKEGHTVKEI